LQTCQGGWLRGCGGATWRATTGRLTPALTQAVTRARGPTPVDPVHRSTVNRIKGVTTLLIWAVRADRTAPVARGQGRRGADGARRCRQTALRRLAGNGRKGAPVRQFRRRMHGEKEEEAGKFTGGLKRREGRRRRRSGRRFLRRRSGGGGAPARAAARSSRRRGGGAGRGGLEDLL
jgi:hypothetical protein